MAITTTTLAAGIGINDNTVKVTSATGASTTGWMQIDGEFMIITAINSTTISVRSRGKFGGAAKAHNALAPVSFGSAEDLNVPPPSDTAQRNLSDRDIQSYSVNGAVDIGKLTSPKTDILMTKAGVLALTIASPTAAIDGYEVRFIASTANAHTLNYSAGFAGDTTASDIATFGGAINDSLTIVARNGTWAVVSANGVTVA
jgi:hypothetical protein